MTSTDPVLLIVLAVVGILFLGLAGVLEWAANRSDRVARGIVRIVDWILR